MRERGRHVAVKDQWENGDRTDIRIGGANIYKLNERKNIMNIQREIKSYMAREGFSMRELVERLAITHKWSKSLSNFSGKLQRGSLRYKEAEEVADVLGYDIVWKKRKE